MLLREIIPQKKRRISNWENHRTQKERKNVENFNKFFPHLYVTNLILKLIAANDTSKDKDTSFFLLTVGRGKLSMTFKRHMTHIDLQVSIRNTVTVSQFVSIKDSEILHNWRNENKRYNLYRSVCIMVCGNEHGRQDNGLNQRNSLSRNRTVESS